MYKSILSLGLILLLTLGHVVGQGINFEEGPWKEVIDKAKKEDKLIYMDAYAVWCGPCKMMAKNIFPNQQVGEKYNKLFINYSVDAEKGEGIDIAKKYAIRAYPTHLFIDPHTEDIVIKQMGATDVNGFLRWADMAEAEYRDTLTLEYYEEQFAKGIKAENFLVDYINKAAMQAKSVQEPLDAFVQLYTRDLTNDKWNYIMHHTNDINSFSADFIRKVAADQKGTWTNQHQFQFNQWLNKVFNESIKEAIIERDVDKVIAVSQKIENDENFPHFFNLPYDLLEAYYQNIKDSTALKANNIAGIENLLDKEVAEFEQHDAKMKAYIQDIFTTQIKANNPDISDEELAITVEESMQMMPMQDTRESRSNMFYNTIDEIIKEKDKKMYGKALAWNRKALEISTQSALDVSLEKQYIVLLVLNNKKRDAQKALNQLIKKQHQEIKIDNSDDFSYDNFILKHLKV